MATTGGAFLRTQAPTAEIEFEKIASLLPLLLPLLHCSALTGSLRAARPPDLDSHPAVEHPTARALSNALLPRMEPEQPLFLFHGGDYSASVAETIGIEGAQRGYCVTTLTLDQWPEWCVQQQLVGEGARATALLLVTTAEDEKPDPQSATCLRFLRRKSHGPTALAWLAFAVLGLGDSNLLATSWRRVNWATPRDCNQAAQSVDAWLSHLGGRRLYARGESDERVDHQQVRPWISGLWGALARGGKDVHAVPASASEAAALAVLTPTSSSETAAAFAPEPSCPEDPTGGAVEEGAGLPEAVRRAIYGDMAPGEKRALYQQSLAAWRGSDGYIQR